MNITRMLTRKHRNKLVIKNEIKHKSHLHPWVTLWQKDFIFESLEPAKPRTINSLVEEDLFIYVMLADSFLNIS